MTTRTLSLFGATFLILGAVTGCGSPVDPGVDPTQEALNPQPSNLSTSSAQISGCPVFPADNPWNQDISGVPVDPNSAAYVASMSGSTKFLHPDFGSDPSYGIPWMSVSGSQPMVPMSFAYADESDA